MLPPLLALALASAGACTSSTPAPSGDDGGTDGSPTDSGTTDSGTTDSGSDTGGSDTGAPLAADLVFDPADASPPLVGLGAQIWADDDDWPAALDPMGASMVRVALNPNLGSRAVTLPVDVSAEEWDAWIAAHVLDEAPSFLADLQATRAETDARGITWVAHQWEAPPAWETAGVLRSEHVDDYAALWGALLGWLVEQGIRPEWIELSNEPDGTWNSYIAPEDYDALVVQVRAELDRRGLDDVGIVGPGLSILGSWTEEASPWVPALSDEAVAAIAAWSVHTWDGYAEDGDALSGPAFLADRWQTFLDQVRARDADKPVLATELGSKDLTFDGITYGDPGPSTCGASTESHGYAVRVLAHTALALAAGVDGILYWEAADQDWECSRWGLVDEEGRSRPVHEALIPFTSAVPADGGAVGPEAGGPAATDLPAVAVLGDSSGVVLVVNEGEAAWSGTVAVRGGWTLDEARGFGIDSVRQRDELSGLDQLAEADRELEIDGSNPGEFDGDEGRLSRVDNGVRTATWAPGGTLVGGELLAWSWDAEPPDPPRLEVSADGKSWAEATTEVDHEIRGWHRYRLVLTDLPADARRLRVVLDGAGATWTPQIGDAALDWARDTPGSLPSGDAPWDLTLPPGSAAVLVLSR